LALRSAADIPWQLKGDTMTKDDMKEVLTKSFWQGVKKTFYEALEGPPPTDDASHAPAAGNSEVNSTSDAPPSSATSEQK
jgi:hypothetical protein